MRGTKQSEGNFTIWQNAADDAFDTMCVELPHQCLEIKLKGERSSVLCFSLILHVNCMTLCEGVVGESTVFKRRFSTLLTLLLCQ